MNNLLVRYRIITNRGGVIPFDPSVASLSAGNYVSVFWDDVNNDYVIHKFDDASDTSGTSMPAGPDLGAERVDFDYKSAVGPIPYSFCDGLNLQTFRPKSLFPYAEKISTANHFSCASTVCDLQISDDFTIQKASDFVTADGAIEVTATSSNGAIRYSLDPGFTYSQGQTSGLFAGLLPGSYTITAKDELGCIDQITIEVTVPSEYGVLYRADYTDLNGISSRVDILERGYTGAVIEVDSGPNPFILRMGFDANQDKFYPIMTSEGILTLWSPSNFYFRDLFTQDERKYQMRWHKNYGIPSAGFTPAALPTLDLWTNLAGAGENWTPGLMPSVTVPTQGESDMYLTAYAFESGRTYSFDYEFSDTGKITFRGIMSILILDSSNEILDAHFVRMQGGQGWTGTFTYTATEGAAGIAIRVEGISNSSATYTVDSFTNTTQSIPGSAGDYELRWLGYLIPNNYSEPYTKDPYPVTITATDGLADLKNFEFLDKDGNKYRDDIITIKAIAEILAKADLDINIQSVINRFETSMTQAASSDPLAQCKFNPDVFYHDGKVKDCLEVLSEILKPFGGVIKQRKGKWFIYNPEELVTSAAYREFDSTGTLVTNGTVEDIANINTATMADRAVMEGGSQMLEVIPAYGKLYLEHTLLKNASLIKSYGFEADDIYTDSSGRKLFKNWNVNISGSPGATYGIKETKSLEGDYNFFLKYSGGFTDDISGNGDVIITAAPITVEYESVDAFEFRFQYATLLSSGSSGYLPWVKLKWSLKIGSYYYNGTTGEWTTDTEQKYNEIIIDRYNEVLEKKITGNFRAVTSLTEETAVVEFVQTSNSSYDFADTTALKDAKTTTRPIGSRVKVYVSSTIVHYYILQEGTDAESLPDVVRPLDYAVSTNERIWVSEDSRTVRGRHVEYNYLDNVVLLHFPDGAQPPDDVTIERTNNTGIKLNFEQSYLLNDIDTENINNSERTYKNFFKLLSGTPTQEWERTYRAGQGKLLDLLSNDIVSQYKTPSNKITGSFLIDTEVLPTTILNEANDGNRKYQFMGYELNDKHATIAFDIAEIKDTVTDPDSEDIAADFNIDFSLDFHS